MPNRNRRLNRTVASIALASALAVPPLALSDAPAHAQNALAKQAQKLAPAAPAAAAAPAAPSIDAARVAFEALPLADRKAIQDALVWTGHYTGTVDGTFGKISFESIIAFQRALAPKQPQTGILDERQRAALADLAAKARQAVKFTSVVDERSGIRIGLPMKWAEVAQKTEGGTRWASRDGRALFTVDRVATGSDADLAQLFEQIKTGSTDPTRKVGYAVLRPDWFVVTAETQTVRSYTRFARGTGELRGFSVSYDKTAAGELDRVTIAVANSFEPFPSGTPVAAAATAPQQPGEAAKPALPAVPGAATTAPTPVPGAPVVPAGASAAAPVVTAPAGRGSGSGVVVAPGKVLTSARLVKSCRSLTVAGAPARLGRTDDTHGLALLDTDPALTRPVLALADLAPPTGASMVALFNADAGAGLMVVAGEAIAREDAPSGAYRLVAGLQRGGAGAMVADRSGAVSGLVLGEPGERRLIAGVVPEAPYPVAPAADIGRFLTGIGIQPAAAPTSNGSQTAGTLVDTLGRAVVPVLCQN